MAPKLRPSTILFAFIALSSVTGQTFQYSRGWTNGKRDGHRRGVVEMREIANNLERALSPCQVAKLRYVLEGKPLNERLLDPCVASDDESETLIKPHYNKNDRSTDPINEAYL